MKFKKPAFLFLIAATALSGLAVADNCEPIREAIRDLPSSGGVVDVEPAPTGYYECTAPIAIDRSHVTLAGVGRVKVRLAKRARAPVIVIGSLETPPTEIPLKRVTDVRLANLDIDGNRRGQDEPGAIPLANREAEIRRVADYECWGGPCNDRRIRLNSLTIRGASDVRVENVHVHGAVSGGLVTEKDCRRLDVRDLESSDNFFDGIAAYETRSSTFERLNVHNNLSAGFSFDIDFDDNIISDSKLRANGDVGIFMRDSRRNRFQQLRISDSGNHGIFLAEADGPWNPASDNRFVEVTVVDSFGAGVRVNNASCTGNSISASGFGRNRGGAVSLAPGAGLAQDPD